MQKKILMRFVLIVAVVLCTVAIHAQQPNPAAENKEAADEALRQKAFDLLKSLAGQLGTLQSAENRARIGSNIAGSLWTNDEARARAVLALVEDEIKAGLRPPDVNDWEDAQTFMVFLKLRDDTIARLAKHDPEVALAFLRATELSPDIKRQFGLSYKEHQLELQLAKQIASSSPDLALQLARKSMTRGFSLDLYYVVSQLNRKHKEHALVLYKEIVQKLGEADLVQDRGARSVAQALVSSFTRPADESTFRELIGLFIQTAEANGCTTQKTREPDFCRLLGDLILPHIAMIDPARAAQLKRWEPQSKTPSSALVPSYREMFELLAGSTVEEIITLASSSRSPWMEEWIYKEAINSAMNDLDRARKLASDLPLKPETRRAMRAEIDAVEARTSLNDAKVQEELKHLSAFPQAKDRVTFLLSLANRVGPNEGKIALKLLNQASEILDSMKPGRDLDEARLRLAMLYCLHRSDRGLAIMESMVPKLNELIEAAVKLDGYGTRYLREDEWNMTGEGELGSFLTSLAGHAGYFGWCDFDRAVSLAGQFERAEIRMMAQLKLAQGVLAGRPKRLNISGY